MNRLWFGIGLLMALLICGILLSGKVEPLQQRLSSHLETAAQAAIAGHTDSALEFSQKAQQQWASHQHFLAAFTDHEPIEQAQTLFSELSLLSPEDPDFAFTCVHLAQIMRAIADPHGITWWTLF